MFNKIQTKGPVMIASPLIIMLSNFGSIL